MTKKRIALIAALFLVSGVCFFNGCGGGNSPAPTPVTNYTISGQVGTVTASGVHGTAILPVTDVIAIGANAQHYLATYNTTTGSFEVKIVSGCPYAVGFYNKTGSTITLLGYLRQEQVNWHSLPLMDPTGEVTNLGTVEIDMVSIEAIPSISLDDILSQTNMDAAAANLYGQVDGVMSIFTNVDVDSNGVYDFLESKAYLLQITIGTGLSSTEGMPTGEVDRMLNQFNETYYPVPNAYQIIFHAIDAPNPSVGTLGTIYFPVPITGVDGIPRTSLVGDVWGGVSGHIWNFMLASTHSVVEGELIYPTVVPSGTYTFEVAGKGTYTFNNVTGSPLAAVGTTESLIFPVFKMVTNEAGYVTTIHYKWMIREDGVTREATASEVKAVIVDTAMSSNGTLVEASPSLGIVEGSYPPPDPDPNYHAPKKIARDSSYVDISDWNVRFENIALFSCNYKLNSDISLSFMFLK
ncbi:MAG: hypothetical protein WC863_04650 [Patescibacteria group bacterium]